MPQVTVYIRKEDMERWKKIDKKSEFIHNALNPITLKNKQLSKLPAKVNFDILKQAKGGRYSGDSPIEEELMPSRVIKTKEDAIEAVKPLKKPEPVTYTKPFPTA